jgi:pyruvate kinase (EC 2.7.1.40)
LSWEGFLGERKGVNFPGATLSVPTLTEKDIADIRWGIEHQMDYIAVSFVRTRDDIIQVRRVLEDLGGNLKVIAKIETRQSVDNLESIVQVVDGVMVARGDLGVEMATEEVPMAQKRIIDLCRSQGKPVIVATQMLDSMIRNPRPTRAEASDVANAVLDGADAVMLSGETANGKYPLETVTTMVRIVSRTERG